MAFLETPRFPARVSIKATARTRFSNVRTVVSSGFDDVLIRYEQALRTLQFTHPALDQTRHSELVHWFNAVKGMGHRFRAKDWSDYKATVTEGVLGPLHSAFLVGTAGAGYGQAVYLLQKKYVAGALSTLRDIYKPVSTPAISIYRGLVLQTVTTHYTIDYTTGKVTFVADQSRTISSHTPGAQHSMTLASALSPNASGGQRIYITGVTGTAASVLNNLSHAIISVGGAVIQLSTVTTGLTASGGTAAMYPQANEAVNWAGEFDVPVRFDSDEAAFDVIDRNVNSLFFEWSGINLIEVRIAIA